MRSQGWAALLAIVVLSGCTANPAQPGSDDADELKGRISTDALVTHLQEFQRIADANGGSRQTGTAGYDASVDYVVKLLKDKGFDVQTPEFDVGLFRVAAESLTVAGAPVAARAVEFSGASPAAGVTGPLVVVPTDDSPGCQPSDYDGLPVAGAVVLVDRGDCTFAEKAALATERGALAVVIANNVEEKVFSGGMTESDNVRIPVISVSKADGARLRTQPGTATVVVDSRVEQVTSRSVIAQTSTGSAQNVVVVGAHLDTVRDSPGINDNGSGVAAVLETALQMGSAPDVANAVRFAFWGSEEEYLIGSTNYVKSLDAEALKDIALYLNFDMVGSPNPGYFTLDGDPAVKQELVDYLGSVGTTAQGFPADRGGDFVAFAEAGIPVGALFTGAEEVKTAEQDALWGGQAGQPFDPNYHSADDTLANVSRAALAITGPAVAYIVGLYAQDQGEVP